MAEQKYERDDSFKIYPEELKLITDTKHPLYDPRVHRPLNEARIKSIMKYGMALPILVRRNTAGEHEVVDGRGRCREVMEANRRLVAAGKPKMKVTCKPQAEGTKSHLFGLSIVANSCRDTDDPVTEAEKIVRWRNYKAEEATQAGQKPDWDKINEEACSTFGISSQTMNQRIKLLDLSKNVQNAVRSGDLSIARALDLLLYEHHEQDKRLIKILAAQLDVSDDTTEVDEEDLEELDPEKEKKAVKKRRSTRLPTKIIADTHKILEANITPSTETHSEVTTAYLILSWVMGKMTSEELVLRVPTIGPILEALNQKRRKGQQNAKGKGKGKKKKIDVVEIEEVEAGSVAEDVEDVDIDEDDLEPTREEVLEELDEMDAEDSEELESDMAQYLRE